MDRHESRCAVIERDLASITSAPVPWDAFRHKTVLVTGCNGLVPAYVVETLLYLNETIPGQNTTILGLARNKERTESRFRHYAGRPDLRLLFQDVSQPLPSDTRADFVLHGASQASPKYYGIDPVGTILPNVLGTQNLLSAAQQRGAQAFLFLSSGAVYGDVDSSISLVRECDYGYLDPTSLGSCYAESKRMGEALCVSWHHQFGLRTHIARLFHTYGPGMRLDDGRVFADFVADVVHGRPIVMKSDGTAERPFTYLVDSVIGLFTILLKGNAGEAYNLASEDGLCSIKDLAHLLVRLFPARSPSVIIAERDSDGYIATKHHVSQPDISKLKRLGWTALFTLEQGFQRTVEYFATLGTGF